MRSGTPEADRGKQDQRTEHDQQEEQHGAGPGEEGAGIASRTLDPAHAALLRRIGLLRGEGQRDPRKARLAQRRLVRAGHAGELLLRGVPLQLEPQPDVGGQRGALERLADARDRELQLDDPPALTPHHLVEIPNREMLRGHCSELRQAEVRILDSRNRDAKHKVGLTASTVRGLVDR